MTRNPWEPRPDNLVANQTVPDVPVPWAMIEAQLYWTAWIANRNKITGNYTGTTDEIIRWGACKWGIDENTIRAVAVQESDWHMSFVGDNGASFGITQVRDHYASTGLLDFGGYPWTQKATALNVDFYGAWIRSCLEGDFYAGGSSWLYGGTKVTGDLWGCVGAWNSGSWHDPQAENYISLVKTWLAQKTWLTY